MSSPTSPRRYLLPNTAESAASLLSSNERESMSSTRSSILWPKPPRTDRKDIASMISSISDQYSLAPDPAAWGLNISASEPEPDDYLHNPDPKDKRNGTGTIFTLRGLQNLGCMFLLIIIIVGVFAGYPITSYFLQEPLSTLGGFNLGGINSTGQIPSMSGGWGLIDVDTPREAMTHKSYKTGEEMELVFSDEFNTDGRTFYPGDDPYWEAVDLHYWGTDNLEWYDPQQAMTKNGALEITLVKKPSHGLNYEGALISTWNKFCFTGGMVLTSVTLPGDPTVEGLWPAVWAMGNLGRAAYGATLDGTWPYSYDACDVGTAPNQTVNNLPLSATTSGIDIAPYDGVLSYQPGQRLSRCTCPGESHQGPMHADGTFVGRAAPEIDVFEAVVLGAGHVSQSAQWAPFNNGYNWLNTADNEILGPGTEHNSYKGGVFQQTTSGIQKTNQDAYELTKGELAIYGFEYVPGYDDAYISWINDNKLSWTVMAGGLGPDPLTEISARPMPQEPMYLLANLGISQSFGNVDVERLTFPAKMRVDWIRVYQPVGKKNIGCDPIDFPTKAYIDRYIEAYTNPNYTTWEDDFKQPTPKNRLVNGGC